MRQVCGGLCAAAHALRPGSSPQRAPHSFPTLARGARPASQAGPAPATNATPTEPAPGAPPRPRRPRWHPPRTAPAPPPWPAWPRPRRSRTGCARWSRPPARGPAVGRAAAPGAAARSRCAEQAARALQRAPAHAPGTLLPAGDLARCVCRQALLQGQGGGCHGSLLSHAAALPLPSKHARAAVELSRCRAQRPWRPARARPGRTGISERPGVWHRISMSRSLSK